MGGSALRLRQVNKPNEPLVSAKIPLTREVQLALDDIGVRRAMTKKFVVSRVLTWFAERPCNYQAAILGQLDPETTRKILAEVDKAAKRATRLGGRANG